MRRLATTLLVLILVPLVAAGALLWRLGQGPLPLPWLEPMLQAMATRSLPYAVTFREPSLVWQRDEGSLALGVEDFAARTPEGRLVVAAPRLAATVALRPLLLEQRLELLRVGVGLPRMTLLRDAEGRLDILFDEQIAAVPLAETTGPGGLAALLGEGAGSVDPRLASLRAVEVDAPALRLEDAVTGVTASAVDAVLSLRRDDGAWSATLSADIGGGRVTARSRATATPPWQEVTVELANLQPRELATLLPGLPLGEVALPVSGTAQLLIDPATGERGTGDLDLRAGPGTVAATGLGLAPLTIAAASLRARLEPGWAAATVEAFRLSGDGFGIGGSGHVALADGRPALDLELAADDLDVAEALRLWPSAVAAKARDWLAGHVGAGQLDGARLQVTGRASRPGQHDLSGGLAFRGLELRWLDGFPPLTGGDGTLRLAGDSLVVTLAAGRSGEVTIGKGEATVSNLLGAGPARLALRLDLRSSLAAALRLLDAEPIRLAHALDVAPAAVGGRQETSLTLGLPLQDPLPKGALTYRADSRISDLAVAEARPGYALSARELAVTALPAGVAVEGEVALNGVPLRLALHEHTPPVKGVAREIMAAGRLDAKAAAALGLAWPAGLGGTIGVEASLSEGTRPLRSADLRLDLRDASLDLPALGLTKRAGEAGSASASLTQPDAAGMEVERAQLELAGWSLAGSAALALEPLRLTRLGLDRAQGPLGDLTARLALEGGVWRGRVDIGTLDARPLWQGQGAGDGTALPDLALDLSAASLRLGMTPLSRLTGTVGHEGGFWRQAALRARADDNDLRLDLNSVGERTALLVQGSDAGAVLGAFSDSDPGVRGGTFRLSADLLAGPGGWDGRGHLKIREFTLRGAPLIARILSLASFSGLGAALTGQGMPMHALEVSFRLDRGTLLRLDRARLVGSDLGLRADGSVDLAAGRIDLSGTVAPAYTLNRLLGRIPLLGPLMSGSRSDAALAATFTVSGPLADPQVRVNPLAALVPGAIRELFAPVEDDDTAAR